MAFKIRLFTAISFWTFLNVVCCSKPNDICPNNGESWRVDKKDENYRCILTCSDGDVPSGCHVVRPLPKGGYNKPIPFCKEGPSIVSGSTLAKVGVGVAAAVAAPYALAAAGFGAAGVAVGSLAAWLQGPATVAGGWFAGLQSAGAAGLTVATQVGIGSLAYTASDYVMTNFKGCEPE